MSSSMRGFETPRASRIKQGRTSSVSIAAFLLLQPLAAVEYARADLVWPPCGDRHAEAENYWNYDADAAYVFGLRIQDAVLGRDLDAIFSLVDGELDRGPRRKFVENRSFDEIFPESWRREILDSEPGCEPVGWRGFLLADGLIRYGGDPFRITVIHGAVEEELPPVPTGWAVDGKLLSPECFAYEWVSGDNFEAFGEVATRYGTGFDGANPGKHLDDRFHPFDPIYSWGKIISPWRNPADCNTHPPERLSLENSAVRHTYDRERPSEYMEYRIIAEVSAGRCRDLAPGLGGRCIESYLVELSSPGGSTSFAWYYIYGLFQVEGVGKMIFPLKRFRTSNLALNFLDDE